MVNCRSLLVVSAAVTVAQALSTACTTQITELALGGLGSCLQLTSLIPVLSGSGSIVGSLNGYLGTLCASTTPTCSNDTLNSAQSSITSGCSSDISSGGTTASEVQALQVFLRNYPEVYTAACSKNSTTNDYCVTDTLYTIQNISGTDLGVSYITSLLTGNSTGFTSVLSSGQLCTGCVQTIYQQAVKADANISTDAFGTGLAGQCGASFVNATATGVSTASVSATSAASSSTSASASSAAGQAAALGLTNVGVTAGVMLAAVALGGGLVL